ncbi:MAG: hypothetical protein IJY27_02890 [Clostridia bacterium]|nr:hypothetical protein [Clostridia bacterium]
MLILWIFLAVLAILLTVALLLLVFARLRVVITANHDDIIKLKFYLCGIPVYSYGAKEKKHHKKAKISDYSPKKLEKKRQKALRAQAKKQAKKQKGTGAAIEEIKRSPHITNILKFIIELLKNFTKHYASKFKVTIHRFNISVATDDAAKTALLYGGVVQSANYLLEFLRNTTALKIPRSAPLNVTSDFCDSTTKFDIKLSVIIRLRKVISLLFRSGLRSPADIEKFFK